MSNSLKKLLSFAFFIIFISAPFAVAAESTKPLVVATTGMIADLVAQVAKDKVTVTALMGPGVDPHLYKATHGDLTLLTEAQLVFYNGLHLEGKMQEVFEGLKKRKTVIAVADVLDKSTLRQPAQFAGQYDPHIWFNVKLWSKTLDAIIDGLVKLLPNDKEYFTQNAQAYRETLNQLDKWVGEQINQIPQRSRVLITAHDAFGYFGEAYGIEVTGLQGMSTASEFGLADIERLTSLIIERKIKAIFVETSVPQRFILSIQEGVAARGGAVAIGGTLYSDALGEPGSGGESYLSMVKKNVETIVKALK